MLGYSANNSVPNTLYFIWAELNLIEKQDRSHHSSTVCCFKDARAIQECGQSKNIASGVNWSGPVAVGGGMCARFESLWVLQHPREWLLVF